MLEDPLRSHENQKKIERHGLQDIFEKDKTTWKIKGMEGLRSYASFRFIPKLFPRSVLDSGIKEWSSKIF